MRKLFVVSLFFAGFLFALPLFNPLLALDDPQNDPDINIRLRGWVPANPIKGGQDLIDVEGDTDDNAPQLSTLFGGINTNPSIGSIYQIKDYHGIDPIPADGSNNWGVTMMGIVPWGGEIKVPQANYDIGGGYQAVILYATENDITISYTNGSDGIVIGYVIHLIDINVSPSLLSLYRQNFPQGKLVALACGETLGTPRGGEVLTVIRDTGSFMDPRSSKDWWHAPANLNCIYIPPTANYPPPATIKNCRGQEDDPEYHSLRPYPACPWDGVIKNTAKICGNSVVVNDAINVPAPPGFSGCTPDAQNITTTCHYTFDRYANVQIDFSKAELPILGNTEDVSNRDSQTDKLTNEQKVNNYVSWYLNGVNNRAESMFNSANSAEAVRSIVDLSGPINKLLPQGIQWIQKEKTVNRAAGISSSGTIPPTQHNQIAACTYGIKVQWCIPIFGCFPPDPIVIGDIPAPCNDKSIASIAKLSWRLKDWLGKFPPDISDVVKFPTFQDYYKAYQEWRGKICLEIVIPSIPPIPTFLQGQRIILCGDDPGGILKPNFWSNLFPYIPYSSTEDRVGKAEITAPADISGGDVNVTNIQFNGGNGQPVEPKNLFFAHTEELVKLSGLLQKTFATRGASDALVKDIKKPDVGNNCKILDSRSNPGDNLLPGQPDTTSSGILSYSIAFNCTFDIATGSTTQSCTKNISVPLSVETFVPNINTIWARLVGGASSVFRRIYPKTGDGGIINKIKDTPGSAQVSYSLNNATDSDITLKKNSGEIYFPHVGALQEYFLSGIQKALRPKGFSESSNISGSGSGTGTCPAGIAPYCSVENLLPYFDNDTAKATKASQICQSESGSNPSAMNTKCFTGESLDYSVGLFQINLIFHCPGALVYTEKPISCTIINQSILNQCQADMLDPIKNIQKAYEISNGGTIWGGSNRWENSAKKCGID